MLRRIHVSRLFCGDVPLDSEQAHHARDVLRLTVGTELELFDDAGQVAGGRIISLDPGVVVHVEAISSPGDVGRRIVVASAVPKGDRADWMVEKLSELGVSQFIPLSTERSVVHPTGKNKIERWQRTAIESAKQSRRAGVMAVSALMPVAEAMKLSQAGFFLSTQAGAEAMTKLMATLERTMAVTLFIGPEGGWTEREIADFAQAGFAGARLTRTVLRVETAAVAAAMVASCFSDL